MLEQAKQRLEAVKAAKKALPTPGQTKVAQLQTTAEMSTQKQCALSEKVTAAALHPKASARARRRSVG